MIIIEVLGAVALGGLLAVSTWMAVVGLLGALGSTMFRCQACGHLLVAPRRPGATCPYCRHPWLASHLTPLHVHHVFPGEMAAGRLGPGRQPRA
jgi:hypothetical protein